MPGSISLPQAVLDLEAEDRQRYEAMKPPDTLVVRYAYTRRIAELPYDGKVKPGCGSKVVIRTDRGTELAEMLTTTCANSGCGKSVSRQQMLDYIEASGGKDFPFGAAGKVLRLATAEDILEQQKLDSRKMEYLRLAKSEALRMNLVMRLVEVELLLGGERMIFHYTSEQRVDFRELVRSLAAQFHTRIEMHQVSARDEARLVADFEKCGQHCCCRQFLKVLKPVSMRMAKVQKATLDPTKISGRCGRLMCCLRYEDETYETLKKRLPRKQSRMMTPDGPGTVIDGQILTQLALLRMDNGEKIAAYPVESLELIPKDSPLFRPPLPPPPPHSHHSSGGGASSSRGSANGNGARNAGRNGEGSGSRPPQGSPGNASRSPMPTPPLSPPHPPLSATLPDSLPDRQPPDEFADDSLIDPQAAPPMFDEPTATARAGQPFPDADEPAHRYEMDDESDRDDSTDIPPTNPNRLPRTEGSAGSERSGHDLSENAGPEGSRGIEGGGGGKRKRRRRRRRPPGSNPPSGAGGPPNPSGA